MFPEANRREKHLLGGLGLQVLVVGLLVFVYTQAARQLNYQRGQFLKFQEQLSAAKAQVAKAGSPDLEKLRAQVAELEGRLAALKTLPELAKTLESSAKERFGFHDVTLMVGVVEKTVQSDLPDRPAVAANLVGLELKGAASTRETAAFLDSLTSSLSKFLFPLQSMQLEAQAPNQQGPLAVRLKWLVAVSPESESAPTATAPSAH
ncbi:MAG: hypothetical protein HY211_02020 [Candidatus Omnitrophica bacterium]|nr:hypothetical protein [Candidatus Omnitrophota bacterium]